MSRLTLFFLGAPRMERDGMEIEVDTRKAVALMAYLAVTRQSHSRGALAALFWPEYDQARAALRRTLSALNKALAGDWLDADRESIGLKESADLWVDVVRFQGLLSECKAQNQPAAAVCPPCLAGLAEAVALYRDDFLAGFTLRDSPGFDDWQLFQTESLRRDLGGALERLARCHSALGEFDEAISYARRWLALDPLHEPAHRHLMQLYAWSGQHAAALRQYRECVRVLEAELGVPPLAETTGLYQAIKENRTPSPPSGPRPRPLPPTKKAQEGPPRPEIPPVARQSDYPLVGRETEWAALLNAYAATATDGRFVVLEGEAGIGKTRLAAEFVAYVQAKGAMAIVARCYEGEASLTFGPFVEGLRAAAQPERAGLVGEISAHWLSEAARLLPELAVLHPGLPSAPPLDSPGAQSRFFEGVSQTLLALCGGDVPGVLFLDDLHWADEASLDLLTYLVRRLRGRPLCIVATWRGEDVSSAHRLRHLLAEAQRAGTATIIPLTRLSRRAVMELVEPVAAAGGLLSGSLSESLYRETEGLPFFLIEYLATITSNKGGVNDMDLLLSGGVRDLLHSRLAATGETGRQLLSTAAIIGRSFDFDTLHEASGRSAEETVAALEELVARGLVQEVKGGSSERGLTYDFSHEKLRALVYEETGLARRRLLHRRAADALVAHARGPRESGLVAGQIAQHYRLAGQEGQAAEHFQLAGDHARSLYANVEALTHYRSALALGRPSAAALHEAIGDLLMLLGEYGEALVSYETAAALCGSVSLAGVERKLGNVYLRRGQWELAESHFRAARAALGEGEAAIERGRVYADWSLAAYHRGEIGEALYLAQQALLLAEAAHDMRALAQVHNILGILNRSRGDLDQAQRHLEQSVALAEALGDPSARAAALNNLALVCAERGEVDRALRLTETALALCAAQGDRHREAALHNNLADLFHAAGQPEASMAHLKQAVATFAEIDAEAGAVQPEIWKLVEW